jgi:heterotetrameric sarcosine oxidase gamma subunit
MLRLRCARRFSSILKECGCVADAVAIRSVFEAFLTRLPADAGAAVSVSEVRGLGLATVMARRGGEAALAQAVKRLWAIDLLDQPRWTRGEGLELVGVAPATWLAIGREADPFWAIRLSEALDGLASVSDQSSAYGVLRLGGSAARELLQAGLFCDLDETAFAAGAALVSAINHMGIALWRLDGAAGLEVAAFRSQAESFAHWLEAAASAAGIDLGSVRTEISGEGGGPGGMVDPPRPGVAAGMA